jgi:hypothetical protein
LSRIKCGGSRKRRFELSYLAATKQKSDKCTIRLFRVRGRTVGTSNGSAAPISGCYALRASLTASERMNSIAEITYPLPGDPLDGKDDTWCNIRKNPELIHRVVEQLSAKARKLGYKVAEVRDHQDDPKHSDDGFYGPSGSKLVSTQKLSGN